jgi:hypothetical protein
MSYLQSASQLMHGESCDDYEVHWDSCHKTLDAGSWALALPRSAYQLGLGSACHKTLDTGSWALALPQSAYQLGPGSACHKTLDTGSWALALYNPTGYLCSSSFVITPCSSS